MGIRRFLLFFVAALTFFLAGAQTTIVDSLQQIIGENKQDIRENRALNDLASEYTRKDMAKAILCLYRAMELSRRLKNEVMLSNGYSQMVTLKLNTGYADSARYYLDLLKALSFHNEKVTSNYNFTAGLFYKIQGNFKAALPFMIASLNYYTIYDKMHPSPGSRINIAGESLNVGNTYSSLGENRNALRYHLKALAIFEETGNRKGASFCFQSIGGDFLQLHRFPEATYYTQKGIVIKQALNDKRGTATALGQMGSIYQGLGQYDKALNYFFQSLKIAQDMKLTAEELRSNFNLGKVYSNRKDTAQARTYFQKSKMLALEIRDSSTAAAADAALIAMKTGIRQQQFDEQKLLRSLQTAIEMGDRNSEVLNYQYLADHYANDREFEKALAYSNRFHQANDSLQGRDVQIQLKKLEDQFNFEKKEQEIILLKKDQQLSQLSLQKQKSLQWGALLFLSLLLVIGFLVLNRNRIVQKSRRLIELERMRSHIARDLHDDIGSTLTSINILSKMALEQARGNGETIAVSSLQKIKDRSAAIMESVGDIVWAINPHNDTMEKMLFRMKEFTAEILDPLKINYAFIEDGDLSTITLDIEKRKDFYLVFKEAVNNAAKYSACTNLNIHLSQNHQSLHLSVVDNGKGFNRALVRNGNGLDNMRERASAMDSVIRIETAIGKGTGIILDIPTT